MTEFNRVLCLIVTYNPDCDLLRKNIRRGQEECHRVLVVDNSPSLEQQRMLESLCKELDVDLITLGYNSGVAKALNMGFQFAKQNSYSSLLTMDQDSTLDSNYLNEMKTAFSELQSKGLNVGVLAPVPFDRVSGHISKEYSFDSPYVEREIVMTSGNFITVETFAKVGPFDESLFIDYVDHEYCLKLKKNNFKIFMVKNARIEHSLGNVVKHKVGAFNFFSHNYPPIRRYYRARNRLLLYRMHWGWWMVQDQLFFVKDLFKILLAEENKGKKIYASLVGTLHGLVGVRGAYKINF